MEGLGRSVKAGIDDEGKRRDHCPGAGEGTSSHACLGLFLRRFFLVLPRLNPIWRDSGRRRGRKTAMKGSGKSERKETGRNL